jgi:4-hydroxy-2-oxoheptanedioate aldolase
VSLKQRIHSKETIKIAGGVSFGCTHDEMEAVLSQDDYDLIGTDHQHAAANEDKLVEFCAMADEFGIGVQLRIKHTRHAYLIGNLLDLGPLAIVVPQVEKIETVDEAIDAFYYPQTGKRSWGPSSGYGIKRGMERLEYAEWWNNTGILILQIESVDAVINVRKLAKSGVDMVTFGENDLNFSIESYPSSPFANLQECIAHVQAQLADTHVKVGAGHTPSGLL